MYRRSFLAAIFALGVVTGGYGDRLRHDYFPPQQHLTVVVANQDETKTALAESARPSQTEEEGPCESLHTSRIEFLSTMDSLLRTPAPSSSNARVDSDFETKKREIDERLLAVVDAYIELCKQL